MWVGSRSAALTATPSRGPGAATRGIVERVADPAWPDSRFQFVFATVPSASVNVLHGTGLPCTGATVATSSFIRCT